MIMQGQEHFELAGPAWPHPPPMHVDMAMFTLEQLQVFQMYQILINLRKNSSCVSLGKHQLVVCEFV